MTRLEQTSQTRCQNPHYHVNLVKVKMKLDEKQQERREEQSQQLQTKNDQKAMNF